MYKPITYNTNLLTEETDSFVNKLDPSKVFKSKNKTLIPKKKGPPQPAGGQKGPSGPPSTSKSSSGSGNPVRKWAPHLQLPTSPTAMISMHRCCRHGPGLRVCVWNHSPLLNWVTRILGLSLPLAFTRIPFWKNILRSYQESFPHTPYSRLCHLLHLEAVENLRSCVSD